MVEKLMAEKLNEGPGTEFIAGVVVPATATGM
jgi:hypothetical protein